MLATPEAWTEVRGRSSAVELTAKNTKNSKKEVCGLQKSHPVGGDLTSS